MNEPEENPFEKNLDRLFGIIKDNKIKVNEKTKQIEANIEGDIGISPGVIYYRIKPREFSVEFQDTFPPNNISFTWSQRRGMFVLGLTLRKNDPHTEKPPISGTYALGYLEKVARQLGVDKIFISDSSFVKCPGDPSKEIDHFLYLRILQGKEGFYKRGSTNYYNRETALQAIDLLREQFLNEETRTLLSDYESKNPSACTRVNELLVSADAFLKAKSRENGKQYDEAIKEYIMDLTPKKVGGRRKRRTRKSLKRTTRRRVSK